MALHTISLCSGGAGLDIGLELETPGAREVVTGKKRKFRSAAAIEDGVRRSREAPQS